MLSADRNQARGVVLTGVLLCCGGCFSSVFSRLPAASLKRAPEPGQYELTTDVNACGMVLPAGSQLTFDRGLERDEQAFANGLRGAVLGGPAALGGHTYGSGTKFIFHSEPKKLLGAERCEVLVITLVDEQRFGPNVFGPSDQLSAFMEGNPTKVFLHGPRSVGGALRAAGDQLGLDAAGQVVSRVSRQEQENLNRLGEASAARQKQRQDECHTRCAVLAGVARADCINNCLYH